MQKSEKFLRAPIDRKDQAGDRKQRQRLCFRITVDLSSRLSLESRMVRNLLDRASASARREIPAPVRAAYASHRHRRGIDAPVPLEWRQSRRGSGSRPIQITGRIQWRDRAGVSPASPFREDNGTIELSLKHGARLSAARHASRLAGPLGCRFLCTPCLKAF